MSYAKMIVEDTGCSSRDARMVEAIMRHFVFHSTLDWQSRTEFRAGALEAVIMLEADRPMFEAHFRRIKECFEQMKTAPQQ